MADTVGWTLNGPPGHSLTKEQVAALLGVRVKQLDRLIARGEFPRGINAGGKRLLWSGLDVAAYLYLRSRCRAGPADPEPDEEDDEDEPPKKRAEKPA